MIGNKYVDLSTIHMINPERCKAWLLRQLLDQFDDDELAELADKYDDEPGELLWDLYIYHNPDQPGISTDETKTLNLYGV